MNSMTYVQTVQGPIAPEELGLTLPHEHIICDQGLCRRYRDVVEELPWGSYMWLDEVDMMIDELRKFKDDGGGAVVDVTCHGWGRDPLALKEISRKSGVHIIACAGFYVEDCMPSWIPNKTVNQLAKWIVREVTIGCNARSSDLVTDVRAGIIKTSVSRPTFSNLEQKCLKAVAKAHLKTGAPITSHNSGSIRFELDGGNIGSELLDYLEAEGVEPEAVIVGHTDENPDIRNLTTLAKRGAYIQFDTIGKPYILDETRVNLTMLMKNRGLLDHILLSHDQNRKPSFRKYGGPGYSDIIKRFVPMLMDKGMTSEDIEILLVNNPRKALRIRSL
jgi:phosphotriesterase-related protein